MSMEQSTESLLYPYVTAPHRIALDIVDALAACPAVSLVALFGSLAEGRHDGWSDIDVLCGVEGEDGAWQAAEALRRAVPLRWHGAFSGVAAPSGRHWLLGESVFNSVDLSFAPRAEVEVRMRDGFSGQPLTASIRLDRAGAASEGRPALDVVSEEYPFTHALYAATKAMRQYLRAEGAWDDLVERMKDLDAAYRGLAVRPVGSEPDALMQEARTLYYALMQERLRYGGDQ